MRHKLAAQICGNQIHLKRRKVKVVACPCKELFYPSVQTKVTLAWCEQECECRIFETENSTRKNGCHYQHPKQHPAEHLKMPAKCQHLVVFTHPSALAEFLVAAQRLC